MQYREQYQENSERNSESNSGRNCEINSESSREINNEIITVNSKYNSIQHFDITRMGYINYIILLNILII